MPKSGTIISAFQGTEQGTWHSWEDVPDNMTISFKCNFCGREMSFRKKDIPAHMKCRECGNEIEIHAAQMVKTVQ